MATHHASSGEIIDLRPLGAPLDDTQSTTLLHDEQLRVMRFVLPAGKELPEHAVEGPITMHCLEGAIDVTAHGSCKTTHAGDFISCIWRAKCLMRCGQRKMPPCS